MKKILITGVIMTVISVMFFSCRKADNPKLPALIRVPVPTLIIDQAADVLMSDPANFKGKFSVDLFFHDDVKPAKLDIVVTKNGDYSTNGIKMFKPDITTFPTVVDVPGTALTALFGPTKFGDYFEFGANITLQDGSMIPVFDSVGAAYGQTGGNVTDAGAFPIIKYKTPCGYDQSIFNGSYTVVIDSWADFNPGDKVNVAPGPGADQISLTVYPSPLYGINRKPIIVDIDPSTAKAVVAPQVVGDYPDPANYLNFKVSGTPGANSFVDFCDGKIHLALDLSSSNAGALGSVILEIVK